MPSEVHSWLTGSLRTPQCNAKELGMRPDFTCTAEKQRKKPYRLDPLDKGMVVPISLSRFLRRYQRIGIQFFYDRYKGIKVEGIGLVKGGILGDDMGLGKTIQVLGFVSVICALFNGHKLMSPYSCRQSWERRERKSTWSHTVRAKAGCVIVKVIVRLLLSALHA